MLFNSYIFIFLFLPVTLVIYFLLNKQRLVIAAKAWLVLASLFFYSFWNPKYLALILSSMLINFAIGSGLNNNEFRTKVQKKSVLIFGIIFNIALLGYYKYADFFINNFNTILGNKIEPLNLILPLAISFFTFQQIAYLVDSYKKETKEYDFLNYALFVTFFPQLIAGPIVHHSQMMPQFAAVKTKILNHKNITLGLFWFTIGLFKKVILADGLSEFVQMGYDPSVSLSFVEGWLVALSYTFQIYFDFSGYTDMAIGVAKMFNINLPVNFNSPYKADSIQDFWRRWHITLSRFLRDYIYIPLGGNKKGQNRTYLNLFLTFLIGGLWHGASWMFVIWGAMHGLALIVHRLWQKLNIAISKPIATASTFIFVVFTWVFFRAETMDSAIKITKTMLGFSGFLVPKISHLNIKFQSLDTTNYYSDIILYMVASFVIVFTFKNSNEIMSHFKVKKDKATLLIVVLTFVLLNLNKVSEFLYFNF